MAEFFGRTESSETTNGVQVTTFRIPAMTEGMARRRGKMNARVKGFDDYEIVDVQTVESGSIPGQTLYDITVSSQR